jgi:hypothetical protein
VDPARGFGGHIGSWATRQLRSRVLGNQVHLRLAAESLYHRRAQS